MQQHLDGIVLNIFRNLVVVVLLDGRAVVRWQLRYIVFGHHEISNASQKLQ